MLSRISTASASADTRFFWSVVSAAIDSPEGYGPSVALLVSSDVVNLVRDESGRLFTRGRTVSRQSGLASDVSENAG